MADLNYKFTGVNTAQLANEVQLLRQNSSTFRALEAAAAAAGYKTIEIRMGAGLLPGDIADSTRTNSSTRTIRINSDATGSWGVGGRQATVGEVIAHELAHAVVPSQYQQPGVIDPQEKNSEGMWVRRQAGQVATDLGLPGPNNADNLITRIPVNQTQGCTVRKPQGDGARDGVLFLDGSRGYNGIGSTIPPGSGSQDSIKSRRLATDEMEQDRPPMDSGGPFQFEQNSSDTALPIANKNFPYLSRSDDNNSPATVFDTGAPAPPDRQDSFGDRFGKWGSSPADIAPLTAPDRPDSFDNRFGNWGSAAAGDSGNPRSPVSRALQRSVAPDGSASTSAQGAAPATPAFQPNIAGAGGVLGGFIGDRLITPAEAASPSLPLLPGPTAPNLPSGESPFGDRSQNSAGEPRPDTYPRLRRVGSAFPGISPPSPDQPVPPPERVPLLGIFSGKPISLSPFPLPPGGLPDNSDGSADGNGFDFLPGAPSGNPRQSAPPQTADSKPVRTLGWRIVDRPQASVFDASAPAAPFAPSDDPNFSGGLLRRLAALAGIDPQNPTQPALPPLDDSLRGFYRDDAVQPWFVQGQR